MTQLLTAQIPGLRRVPALMTKSVSQDVVLFQSFKGRYSDSPRAISEELSRRGESFQHVWVSSEASVELPTDVTIVKHGSWRHLYFLSKARYIVASNTLPGGFRKNSGTTYLQTWHGTPLKRIAFDIENPQFPNSQKQLDHLRREVAQWDFLVSPNRFSTEVLRRAFRYNGEIVETGYPRNDPLNSPQASQIRDRIRSRLGIDEEACVVLYAPTWRDTPASHSLELQLDLDAMTDALENMVVLMRSHRLDASSFAHSENRHVHDVSHYPDIGDLYLAADVLITDYSSVMFDFAVTRKPMLFFTYDMDYYRDELRGFYFDFAAEAPGPLVASTAEVISAIDEIERVSERYKSPYDRFHQKFCHLDDGSASERVIEAVFGL
jgi:CDP-glycerol glycerophosphotransferase